MGVVVVVPGQAEAWKVSNAAFRLLEREVHTVATNPAEAHFMTVALANHGLFLDALPQEERERVANLVALAARSLRRRLLDAGSPSEWDRELARHLPVVNGT